MDGVVGSKDRTPPAPSLVEGVDHLVYAVPDLQAGMDEIEKLLHRRPVPGGRHPGFGTHNALVSLGPTTYLEIIAPDPALPRPDRGVLFFDDDHLAARLATWVVRTERIDDAVAAMGAAGFDLAGVEPGSREKPDGTVLSWRLTDPWAPRLGGALPFLIAWGDTPHPAGAAPRAGELVGLRIEHPEPDGVRRALAVLGLEVEVRFADRFRMVAAVETARGEVELQ